MRLLEDRVAVVTGVSRGIGRAIAVAFAGAGAHVAGVYLGEPAEADSLAAEIDALGRQCWLAEADVSDRGTHDRLVDEAERRWGRLDIWVNNAARLMVKPLLETSDEDWRGLLASNLDGVFYGSRAAVRSMVASGTRGRIINLSSAARILPIADLGAYTAAKGGVLGLTQSMAVEFAPYGITINAIAPGAIDTPLNAQSYTPEVRRTYEERIPLGVIGTAEQMADVAVFLASDASSYITGHELVADGGLTINGSVGHAHTDGR